MQPIEAFPLSWPIGRPRTPASARERAKFGSTTKSDRGNWNERRQLTIDGATSRLRRQIELLNAKAFAGYKALTAAEAVKSWWSVLGFAAPPQDWDAVQEQHASLSWRHHPDRGGDPSQMAAINAARDEARAYYAQQGGQGA